MTPFDEKKINFIVTKDHLLARKVLLIIKKLKLVFKVIDHEWNGN